MIGRVDEQKELNGLFDSKELELYMDAVVPGKGI